VILYQPPLLWADVLGRDLWTNPEQTLCFGVRFLVLHEVLDYAKIKFILAVFGVRFLISIMNFTTDFQYHGRDSKAHYVWLKYQSILKGRILDVGADECHLKQYLPDGVDYWGIGLGGNPDQQVNLEIEKVPFPDNSFDCVLCLDVLEHIENIHEIFDELCRVTRRYVIVSLPNPWASFYRMLLSGRYSPGQGLKFYGLPLERPNDRHKWFFSSEEAEKFIEYRSMKNRMQVLQMDNEPSGGSWRGLLKDSVTRLLFRRHFNPKNLIAPTLWAVLAKADNN
jgi:hypothetical protein